MQSAKAQDLNGLTSVKFLEIGRGGAISKPQDPTLFPVKRCFTLLESLKSSKLATLLTLVTMAV